MARNAKPYGVQSDTCNDVCDICASTGILSATLMKEGNSYVTEDGKPTKNVGILVKLCGEHYSHALAEKNVMAMERITGLKVQVIRPEKKDPPPPPEKEEGA
jgi:hypothetical protein